MKAEFMPQGDIIGGIHNKIHRLHSGQTVVGFRSPGRSKVIMGIDEFGNISYRRLRGLKFDAHFLPRLHRGAEKLFDVANQRNSYATAIRKRTVIRGYKTGESDYREERVGIGSFSERRKITQLRKEKKLKRQLLQAGIDEHKLFLLMHSALHSQTRFERELPIKRLTSNKYGGMSSQERWEMERQRRRNNRLAQSGNIYHR